MKNRIDKKFEQLKEKNQTAFIGFLTAGDPSLNKTKDLVLAMEKGGADIVEIGIPYSDPLADGPVIQKANKRAFGNNDLTVDKIMDVIEDIRKASDLPLLFLVYINTVIVYGKEKFINRCTEVGIDGLIIPDLPFEERDELKDLVGQTNLALIPFAAPTSKDRIDKLVEDSRGFLYCVSSFGVTGNASSFYDKVFDYLQEVKEKSPIPTAVGFGISTKEDVKRFKAYVDGVIVGSAIVKVIEETNGNEKMLEDFIRELSIPLKKD